MQEQEQQPLAVARPQVVITVQLPNAQPQIYDVATATALRDELNAALKAIEAPQPPARKRPAAKKKTARKKKPR